jgi:hypothetical protein
VHVGSSLLVGYADVERWTSYQKDWAPGAPADLAAMLAWAALTSRPSA